MKFILRTTLAGLLTLVALPAQAQSTSHAVLAAWSQIGGETSLPTDDSLQHPKVDFRFVTEASDCKGFSVTYDIAGQTALASTKAFAPRNMAVQFTDITVCAMTMEPDWAQAHLMHSGKAVKLKSLINLDSTQPLDPSDWTPSDADQSEVIVKGPAWIGQSGDLRMVTLGDTGCRGFESSHGRDHQDCFSDWPFEAMATTVSSTASPIDLVVHVGDYRYFFEQSRDTDWQYWQKDFFPAAQELLLAAPWVFNRGNHEGCPGDNLPYGKGYFQLFGSSAGQSCDTLGKDASGNAEIYAKPYYFDVEPGGTLNKTKPGAGAHRFVVIDVNSFSGFPNIAQAQGHFKTAQKMVAKGPSSSWWIGHTPAVMLLYYKSHHQHSAHDHTGDSGVRTALQLATDNGFCGSPAGSEACRPSQILLGHQHLFQSITFPKIKGKTTPANWVFPRQMIIGHGGTKLDSGNPSPTPAQPCAHTFDVLPIAGDTNAETVHPVGLVDTRSEHGLVVWTRAAKPSKLADQSGWAPELWWSDGRKNAPVSPGSSPPDCN